MILYRCDRCGTETMPDKFYETELICTPRDLSGDLDTDTEDRVSLGDLCAACSDALEAQARAFMRATPEPPAPASQDRNPGAPLVGCGDTLEKSS
jgi:hypothetical protein